MYEDKKAANQTMQDCQVKAPYYYEMANEIAEKILSLDHNEQVECFKYLQRKIADTRIDQNVAMRQDRDKLIETIDNHTEGTDKIASGL